MDKLQLTNHMDDGSDSPIHLIAALQMKEKKKKNCPHSQSDGHCHPNDQSYLMINWYSQE